MAGAEPQISPAAANNSSRAASENTHRLSDKEVLAESQAVFPVGDDLVLRGYSNRRWIAQPTAVKHAVVMIHGVLRNPDNYYLPARFVLEGNRCFPPSP